MTLRNAPAGPWYRSYVDYALSVGLLSAELWNYDAPMTRMDFVRLFYGTMPESSYPAINSVPDGAIPDLPAAAEGAQLVYRFYRAGILTGYQDTIGFADNAFGPQNSISRAEVATIINRMYDSSARRQFSL